MNEDAKVGIYQFHAVPKMNEDAKVEIYPSPNGHHKNFLAGNFICLESVRKFWIKTRPVLPLSNFTIPSAL